MVCICGGGAQRRERENREGEIVLDYDQTQAAKNSSLFFHIIIMCENNLIQFIQARDEASELEQRTRRVQ